MTQRKNIYIHIGLPKTGTKTIQYGLKSNEFKLKRIGYLCPQAGRVNRKFYSNHNLSHKIMDRSDYSPEYGSWGDLLEEINRKGQPENIILTSEEFCRSLLEGIKKIRSILAAHDVIIICYLRRQDLWLQSVWSQRIKNSWEDLGLKEWLKKSNYSHVLWKNYEFILDWASIFTTENMRVRILEKKQLQGHLFHDFLSACGIENPGQYQVPDNANVSPGIKTLQLLIKIKKRISKGIPLEELRIIQRLVQDFARENGWNDERVSLIDADLYQKIMSKQEVTNKKIAQEFFGRDELFLEPFQEKEITNYQIGDFNRQKLTDLFLLIISKFIESDRCNFWLDDFNGQDLQKENKRLKAEKNKILSSRVWKLVDRIRLLIGRILRRI